MLIVGIIIGLLLVVSIFLPSQYHIKRSATINAPPDSVFAQIANLKNWPAWSYWHSSDPNTTTTFSPNTTGPGATMEWKSKQHGNGKLVLKSTLPPKQAVYEIMLGDTDFVSTGEFILTPTANGTNIEWTMTGDVGMNPLYKYGVLFMDGLVGPDFEKGLTNLQKAAGSK